MKVLNLFQYGKINLFLTKMIVFQGKKRLMTWLGGVFSGMWYSITLGNRTQYTYDFQNQRVNQNVEPLPNLNMNTFLGPFMNLKSLQFDSHV